MQRTKTGDIKIKGKDLEFFEYELRNGENRKIIVKEPTNPIF